MALKTGKYTMPVIIISIFLTASLTAWILTRNVFFLFDLPYIGAAVTAGVAINIAGKKKNNGAGRRVTQLMVGLYFLLFLNIIIKVNMQLEGFLFQVLSGFFAGAFIHYAIAKIFGPLVFGRGFCGYACWTAMVLDFMPWKKPKGRVKGAGIYRYIHFFLSFGLVVMLLYGFKFNLIAGNKASIYWFTAGNLFYYAVGIMLAYVLKDNRAFCKYVCPVAVVMKPPAGFSCFKLEVDNSLCSKCGTCEKICPMDIKILDYASQKRRILSTECILCGECSAACPKKAINMTRGFEFTAEEYIKYRD